MPLEPGRTWTLTHILIHVEGFHVFKGKVSILIVLDQLLVAAKWGAPCKKHTERQLCSPTYAPAPPTIHLL